MPQKALIILKSIHHGNTRKVAEVMAGVLKARIISPEEARKEDLKGYGLIGFGSGIYGGRHHREILSLAESLSGMRGKRAFIFCTSGAGEKAMEKHQSHLRSILTGKGIGIAGEFSCSGFVTWGPFRLVGGMKKGHPDEKDLDKAREFAKSIIK